MARGSLLQSITVLLLVCTAIYVAHNVVTHVLRVDGGFTVWSEFTPCTVSCGGGTRQRWRACTNPVPKFGGKNCSRYGPRKQTFKCNLLSCPVHGGYGPWSDFSSCSVSCGGGERKRTRPCDKPKPQFGGKSCQARELGPDKLTEKCNTLPCPVNGGYGKWSEFDACTKTCGGGTRKRKRSCDKPAPQHGGKLCSAQPDLGPAAQTQTCNAGPCAVDGGYSEWRDTSPCTVTCGGGTMKQRRTCNSPPPSHGGKTCIAGGLGPDLQTRACSSNPCPKPARPEQSSSSNKTENKGLVKGSSDKLQKQQNVTNKNGTRGGELGKKAQK